MCQSELNPFLPLQCVNLLIKWANSIGKQCIKIETDIINSKSERGKSEERSGAELIKCFEQKIKNSHLFSRQRGCIQNQVLLQGQ